MTTLPESEIEEIRRAVEKDFPHDPALREVHIARKIIAREAEREGLSYLQYVKIIARQARQTAQK
jgi:hypothetical protein